MLAAPVRSISNRGFEAPAGSLTVSEPSSSTSGSVSLQGPVWRARAERSPLLATGEAAFLAVCTSSAFHSFHQVEKF